MFDETVIQMRKGMADGSDAARILLEKVVDQANGIGTQSARRHSICADLWKFPESISAADQKRLREQGLAVDSRVGVCPLT